MTTTTALECLAIGAAPLEHLATRRDTAAAEPIPAGNPTTAHIGGTDAQILGHPSAKRCTAIPTREHHCGGSPIHDVPARRHRSQRSPPERQGNA
jgi:hypothetical protein